MTSRLTVDVVCPVTFFRLLPSDELNRLIRPGLINGNPKTLWIEMVVVGAYARPAVDPVAIFGGYAALNRLRQPAQEAT
jgi:hypothetical protein